MKKRLILLALLVMLTQFVSAEIILNGVNRITFNRGDQIAILSYVLRDDNADGTLDFNLRCGEVTFPLTKRVVSNTRSTQEVILPPIVVPASAEGSCKITTQLIGSGGVVLESQETKAFIVTKSMEGRFEISPVQVQLGKIVSIKGDLIGAGNDKKINGVAEIYMISDEGERSYLGTANLANGLLDFAYVTTSTVPGKYSVQIKAKDIYGNEHVFENIGSFSLASEIYLFAKSAKQEVDPSEKVMIVGDARTVLQEGVPEASLMMRLGDKDYVIDVKDSKFEYELQIPPNMKAGKHKLLFAIKDPYGNTGESDSMIYVRAVQTALKLSTNRATFVPGDKVEITSSLYDQAGDLMTKMINIEMIAPNNDITPLESLGSGQKISFEVLQFATPGIWKVVAKTDSLKSVQDIELKEIKSVDVSLDNQTVVIWNNGNVDYTDPVTIDFNNGQYQITKKTAIKPNEKVVVDLSKEATTGQYDIMVTGAAIANPKKFQDVSINGKELKSANSFYYFLIAVVFAALAYLLLFKRRILVSKKVKEDREKAQAQKTVQRIRETKAKEKPRFYPDRESSIKDYRDQVMKQIKDTEQQDKDRKSFRYGADSSDQPKKKGGLFNMFE